MHKYITNYNEYSTNYNMKSTNYKMYAPPPAPTLPYEDSMVTNESLVQWSRFP